MNNMELNQENLFDEYAVTFANIELEKIEKELLSVPFVKNVTAKIVCYVKVITEHVPDISEDDFDIIFKKEEEIIKSYPNTNFDFECF